MRNVNSTKLSVNRMRQNDDEISLSQITFSLADYFLADKVSLQSETGQGRRCPLKSTASLTERLRKLRIPYPHGLCQDDTVNEL